VIKPRSLRSFGASHIRGHTIPKRAETAWKIETATEDCLSSLGKLDICFSSAAFSYASIAKSHHRSRLWLARVLEEAPQAS